MGFKERFHRRLLMGSWFETTSAVIMPIKRPEVANAKDSSCGELFVFSINELQLVFLVKIVFVIMKPIEIKQQTCECLKK